MQQTHELKTWPGFFQAVLDGRKTFEVRKDDRGFCVGDCLLLREWDTNPDKLDYTGRMFRCWVSYILPGGAFGIEEGYCVLALSATPTQLQEANDANPTH